jgi:hypothetical protein
MLQKRAHVEFTTCQVSIVFLIFTLWTLLAINQWHISCKNFKVHVFPHLMMT